MISGACHDQVTEISLALNHGDGLRRGDGSCSDLVIEGIDLHAAPSHLVPHTTTDPAPFSSGLAHLPGSDGPLVSDVSASGIKPRLWLIHVINMPGDIDYAMDKEVGSLQEKRHRGGQWKGSSTLIRTCNFFFRAREY
jgi:hypothetical protein